MENLIFFGVLALAGLALLRALIPRRMPPPIIYVVTELPQAQGVAEFLLSVGVLAALVVILLLTTP